MVAPTPLDGQRFGRLIVIDRAENDRFGKARWRCRCDCGNEITTRANTLRKGETKSCGCLHAETVKTARRTHGQARSPLYRIWSVMKGRCLNPSDAKYQWYGGRGITVCQTWQASFEQFATDMGPRPIGATLDRRDNNGPYSSTNCRWATRLEQGRNTRKNFRVVYDGQALTLGEWAEKTSIPESALYYRIRQAGWPVAVALTTPSRGRRWSPKRQLTT